MTIGYFYPVILPRKQRLYWELILISLIILFTLLTSLNRADAAQITFSANTPITFNATAGVAVGVNFTVLANSTVDAFVVNPSNVTTTVGVGQSLTMTSVARDFSVTGGASGATITDTCSSGTATLTVSGVTTAQNLVITPLSYQCGGQSSSVGAGTTSSGGGGGGGGGGFAAYNTVATTTTPTSTSTTASTTAQITTTLPSSATTPSTQNLLSQLAALQATLRALIAQAQSQGISLPPGITELLASPAKFSRNLQVGSKGDDVKNLQLFLIKQNVGPKAQALSNFGASGYFGNLTSKALAEYQKSVGITPASGYFGPKTKAYINSLSQ